MESAIRLSYYPLPSAPLSLSKDATFHLRFNHAIATPLSLPRFSTITHPVAPSFRHANCMLHSFSVPSKNEGSNNSKIFRGVTRVSLVLACVLGLFSFRRMMNPKFNTAFAQSSITEEEVFLFDKPQGLIALRSLLEMINSESSKDETPAVFKREPPPINSQIQALKMRAIGLSKCGKGDRAVKILEDAYNKNKKNNKVEQDLGMALIELHLFQKNFKAAHVRIDDQIGKLDPKEKDWNAETVLAHFNGPESQGGSPQSSPIGDSVGRKLRISKLLLYKAIVLTMLEPLEDNEALKWWQAFSVTLEEH